MANEIMHIIFEEQFPDSKSTVDCFEFRLLEVHHLTVFSLSFLTLSER